MEAASLERQLSALHPYSELKQIDVATTRIAQALIEGEHIIIIGDFDADGATSTALAVSALRRMVAKQVSFLVPNRFVFGYGLTKALVDEASKSQPQLIITVDNGISSLEGVSHAHSMGIEVVITDHHLAGDALPEACAIVNPNQPGDLFPSKALAGVGVIFYVMLALRRHLTQSGWFENQGIEVPNMAQYLDLVALGTVADVVPLDQNNRILVHQGLMRMRQGMARPGIQALMEVSGREHTRLRSSDLGFALAPRLNAAGRLDDMSIGIACLLSDCVETAKSLAMQLDTLNDERRVIEAGMKIQAFAALQSLSAQLKEAQLPAGLCLQDESWHQGVIGILAGRLKEVYHRPVIVFAKVSESELKGSARSVHDVNIRDVLAQINQDHPDLIMKFGGHAMAAGISIHPSYFNQFQTCFAEEVGKLLPIERCRGEILTDGFLKSEELTLSTANMIDEAGPWGQMFPEPIFEGVFYIVQSRIVGQKHLKLTLKPVDGEQYIDAIAFNVNVEVWPNHRASCLHAVYALERNVYQQISRLQLVISHMEVVSSPALLEAHA
jgi:single-stranded-DNA-specific exonuclease